MKRYLKLAAISLLFGVVLTFGIGGIKYLALDKPGFDPQGSCGANPLCDPSPYLGIGYPLPYGSFNDASGNAAVLNFGAEDGELVPRYYEGFAADVALYAVLSFGALVLLARIRKTS